MWTRRRTWLVLAALSCVALAVYFEPTRCVRGWLRGEAFFDGRPTSWWRHLVVRDLEAPDELFVFYPPAETVWWHRAWDQCRGWFGWRSRSHCSLDLLRSEDAKHVLHEMKSDPSSHVAGFATDAIVVNIRLNACRGS